MKHEDLYLIVSFYTSFDAFAFQEACTQFEIPGKLISIPRQISAGCGLAWQSKVCELECITNMIASEKLDIEALHEINL